LRHLTAQSSLRLVFAALAILVGGCGVQGTVTVTVEPVVLDLEQQYLWLEGPKIVAGSVGLLAIPQSQGIFSALAIDAAYRAVWERFAEASNDQPTSGSFRMIIGNGRWPSMFDCPVPQAGR
jgi:hypothetical protein